MKAILPLLIGIVLLASACSRLETESESVETEESTPARATEPRLLSTAALAATPSITSPGGREAIFPQTILVFIQEGKFPESPLQWTIYPTGRVLASSGEEWMLTQDQVAPIFDLIAAPAFARLAPQYGSPETCKDCLVYTLNIYNSGQPQQIKIYSDGDRLPEELKAVLEQLKTLTSQL
jgi:hypothetical protein